MPGIWRVWLQLWCVGVVLFGVVLALGGIPATEEPTRLLLDILNGSAPVEMTDPLRFACAVLGAVSIGWGITLHAAIDAAQRLGAAGGPVWRMTLIGVVTWFVIDSCLSVATGFGLNVIPNLVLLIGFLWPLHRAGALRLALG